MNLHNVAHEPNATPDEMLSQAERDKIAEEASTDSLAVRNYSKSEKAAERSALAANLRASHTEYLAQRLEARARIAELGAEIEAGTTDIEGYKKSINFAERAIARDSANLLKRLMNLKNIKRQENRVVSKTEQIEQMTQRLAQAENDLQEMQELAGDKSELELLRSRIETFYQQQGSEYEKAEVAKQIELREKVSVGNIIKEHDVTFVHGVYSYTPEDNSTIYEDTPVETKFEIALGFAPHLSASTVRPGQAKAMLCGYGLLINGGEVTSASGDDSGTQPIAILDRGTTRNQEMPPRETVAADIPDAIHAWRSSNQGRRNYNELTVNQPKFVGIYWSPDFNDEEGVHYERFKPFKEMVEIAENMGAPIFVLREGRIYKSDIVRQPTDRGENIYPTNFVELTAEEYGALPDCVTDDQRARLKDKILTEVPFKIEAIKAPEARITSSICDGRATYFRSGRFNDPARFSEIDSPRYYTWGARDWETREYKQWTQEEVRKNIKVVGKVENIGRVTTFFQPIDMPYENPQSGQSGFLGGTLEETRIWGQPQPNEGYFESKNFITLAGCHGIQQDYSRTTPKGFSGNSYIKYVSELLRDGFKVNGLDEQEARKNLAGHVFGFGLQAQEFGDDDAAQQCFELASSVMALSELQTIVDERKGPDGRLRLKESDLNAS